MNRFFHDSIFFMLDENKNVVPCADAAEWSKWFEIANRHVAEDWIGPYHISTVFLGVGHCTFAEEGYDFFFETMVFAAEDKLKHLAGQTRENNQSIINLVFGDSPDFQVRYRTWADAEKGHAGAVELCKKAMAAAN